MIPKDERKKIYSMGIKLGRYHVYLPKMFKPKSVSLRIGLWKLFYNQSKYTEIPKFGLNFIIDNKFDKKFLLLCGFENFNGFFVRIDILEKLFISIIEKSNNRKFKITTDMINLLGCSKDNFHKLMGLMNYKKLKDDFYEFKGEKERKMKTFDKFKSANPFKKLLSLNIK